MSEGGKVGGRRSGETRGGKSKGVECVPHPSIPAGPKARDEAGKAVGVSGKTIDHATAVIWQGTPELVQAVWDGEVSVAVGSRLVRLPHDQQRAASRPGSRSGRRRPVQRPARRHPPRSRPTAGKVSWRPHTQRDTPRDNPRGEIGGRRSPGQATGEVPQSDTRTGRDGRSPAARLADRHRDHDSAARALRVFVRRLRTKAPLQSRLAPLVPFLAENLGFLPADHFDHFSFRRPSKSRRKCDIVRPLARG